MHDVIIIGGGPAGTAAAMELRRLGHSALVIEQHRFPRDKVCGECLSSLGIDVLEKLGIVELLRKQNPTLLRRVLIHAGDGSHCELMLPRPMWGISRAALDLALLQSAVESGIQLMQPARCEAIYSGTRPSVRVRDLITNASRQIPAKCIVIADGKGTMISSKRKPTGDLGLKAHFANVDGPNDAIELFGVRGHYGGLAPIEGGRWNAAFSIPSATIRTAHGDFDSLFNQMLGQNRNLARRLAGAKRITDWLISPLPRFAVSREWPPGVIPIGNAAAALEPVGGEGMGLAMHSAIIAAGQISDALVAARPMNIKAMQREFHRLWSVRSAVCRFTAIVVSNPLAAEAMTAIAEGNHKIAEFTMRAMGKPRVGKSSNCHNRSLH